MSLIGCSNEVFLGKAAAAARAATGAIPRADWRGVAGGFLLPLWTCRKPTQPQWWYVCGGTRTRDGCRCALADAARRGVRTAAAWGAVCAAATPCRPRLLGAALLLLCRHMYVHALGHHPV